MSSGLASAFILYHFAVGMISKLQEHNTFKYSLSKVNLIKQIFSVTKNVNTFQVRIERMAYMQYQNWCRSAWTHSLSLTRRLFFF